MRTMWIWGGLLATLCSLTCEGQATIKIKCRVHAISDTTRAMVVLMSHGDTIDVRSSRSGRFHFRVEAGDAYLLGFRQPGSITKEVVVDASHALRSARRNKRVEFDVVMREGDPDMRERYVR